MPETAYPPIEEHAVIGDLRTVALVATDGTIDWYCPQRFDAHRCSRALLDAERGGSFPHPLPRWPCQAALPA